MKPAAVLFFACVLFALPLASQPTADDPPRPRPIEDELPSFDIEASMVTYIEDEALRSPVDARRALQDVLRAGDVVLLATLHNMLGIATQDDEKSLISLPAKLHTIEPELDLYFRSVSDEEILEAAQSLYLIQAKQNSHMRSILQIEENAPIPKVR